MPVTIVVGGQWGDEGKGKIVDLLTSQADIAARYQGGANAGHTVVLEGRKYILHLIPSGILHPDCVCVLGAGCVIDPAQLLEEIEQLETAGIEVVGRLFVSHQAHLIMPYHKVLDELNERSLGSRAIGVTGRGIGPAYTDKYTRTGIRIVDLLDRDLFVEKLDSNLAAKNRLIQQVHGEPALDRDTVINYYIEFDRRIDPLVKDVSRYLNDAIDAGLKVVCEGAQGTFLDVDWGTYPFVTSSSPTAGGAMTGLGIGPTRVDGVLGVIKAYTTRVGQGPFPTEFDAELNARVRSAGDEFGSTTGRARRCGWFDAVMARYAARVNGIESWALTKLDVLSHFDQISICNGYEYDGRRIEEFPAETRVIGSCRPILEEMPGWGEPISHLRHFSDLPLQAQRYIKRIEELTGTPVEIVSVGSDRAETIVRENGRDVVQ
ncbi:MAG: adenylosuccinate synthase [Calditrichaeota bacterium]|nr:adenylosuccinate synthase [Calditrichota bacterium]